MSAVPASTTIAGTADDHAASLSWQIADRLHQSLDGIRVVPVIGDDGGTLVVKDVEAPGHRLRVEIASSNFPRFDRNLNTGGDQATGTTCVTARQRVFHDAARPSHILLPVIP